MLTMREVVDCALDRNPEYAAKIHLIIRSLLEAQKNINNAADARNIHTIEVEVEIRWTLLENLTAVINALYGQPVSVLEVIRDKQDTQRQFRTLEALRAGSEEKARREKINLN